MEERELGTLLCTRRNKRIYVRGETLTKLYDHALMPKPKVIKEAWVQSVVETTGLNVPKVLLIYPVGEDWAVDFDYIAGESLLDRLQAHPEKTKEYIDQLIALQLKVHEASCVGLPDMKEKFNKKISALGRVSDPAKHIEATLRYELHVALDKMPAHRKLCHGDFLPDNILFDAQGEPHIFDWAHASLGNGSADAAHTYLQLIIEGHKDWAEMYLPAYAAAAGVEVSYIRSWFPMVAATMLDKTDDVAVIDHLKELIQSIEAEQ